MRAILPDTWRGAFGRLSPQQQGEVYQFAYEAVTEFVESLSGSEVDSHGHTIALNSAAQFLKSYEVYVRKARRYQMRQTHSKEWSVEDLARTLAWKAGKEIQDHLRKIRRGLRKPTKVVKFPLYPDERHKSLIETIINYFEFRETKVSRDAALLIEFLWKHSGNLTLSPKRGVSFKASAIALELTREHKEIWNANRVQRVRAFILDELSQIEGDSIDEVIHNLLCGGDAKSRSAS